MGCRCRLAGLEEPEEVSRAAVHLRVPPPAAGDHLGRLQPTGHGHPGQASANSCTRPANLRFPIGQYTPYEARTCRTTEPEFVNVYGAQESSSLAGRYVKLGCRADQESILAGWESISRPTKTDSVFS
jgi:hypothetical protein